jgi:hypothetical protein
MKTLSRGVIFTRDEIVKLGLKFRKDLNDIILYSKNGLVFWFEKKNSNYKLLTYYKALR